MRGFQNPGAIVGAGVTHFPYIGGTYYDASASTFIHNPGTPGALALNGWIGNAEHAGKTWPYRVPVINLLIGNKGMARAPAPKPVIDRYAPLLQRQMFIGGFVGKSKG